MRHREVNWLAKVTQLVSSRARVWTQGSWLQNPGSNHVFLCCIFMGRILSSSEKWWLMVLQTVEIAKTGFSSVTQSCLTLCDPMNRSMPVLPVRHQLPEFTQTHIHWVGDAIQPSHPLSSPSPPAFNLSQHQGLFKWVSFSHQVAKLLELQLQH